MKRLFGIFTNGIIRENPLLILMIGLCSSLAVTTAVQNGIGMGLSMTFVLLMSEIVISCVRKLIPESVRIPIFIIIIAAFTTVIDYVLKAWFPDLSKAMGVFIPLIVVNCIIMGRVEGFASKQPLSDLIPDGRRYYTRLPDIRRQLSAHPFLCIAPRRLPCFRPVHQLKSVYQIAA